MDADLLVLNTVNASLRRPIDAARLAGCLGQREPIEPWLPHLAAFATEVPREAVLAFLMRHRLDAIVVRDTLREVARRTSYRNEPLEQWLAEMAAAVR